MTLHASRVNKLRALALAALVGGIASLAVAASQGDVRVGFFLIVPYVYGQGFLPFLGSLLLMAAALLWFAGSVSDATRPGAGRYVFSGPGAGDSAPWPSDERRAERRSRSGGVVLLGPIPIVWGSDRRVLPWMVAAGAALLLLGLLVAFALR